MNMVIDQKLAKSVVGHLYVNTHASVPNANNVKVDLFASILVCVVNAKNAEACLFVNTIVYVHCV